MAFALLGKPFGAVFWNRWIAPPPGSFGGDFNGFLGGAELALEPETFKPMPQPKKRAARKLLSQHAWITLDGGFAARHCLVQDISASGAKITLDEDASQLPGVIRMAFARDARTGRSCQVVWRRGKSAGIKFI